MEETKPFKGKRKLGYCSGIITESIVYNVYYVHYLFFLTNIAHLDPAFAGTISLISVFWDAVTDPVIGYYVDKPGADKRKFMLRALFPLFLTFLGIFIPIGNAGGLVKFVFYTVMTMLFWLFYTFYTIPYYAVVADITEDYDERTSIRGLSSLINTFPIAGGAIAPAVLPGLFVGMGLSLTMGWELMAVVTGVISLIFGLLAVRSLRSVNTKAREPENGERERAKWSDIFVTFAQVIKLKPFLTFMIFIFFFLMASSMIQSNLMYTIDYCLKGSHDVLEPIFIGGLVLTMAVVIPLVTKFAEKFDRKTACLVFFAISFVGLIVIKIIGVKSIPVFVCQPIVLGFSSGAFWTLFYTMAYDLVEVDEFKHGKRRESVITGLPQFFQKFGSAVGMWTIGLILKFTGYDATLAEQTPQAVKAIENMASIIPAVLLGVSMLALAFYPVTRKRMEILQGELEKKRDGKEYSSEGIEKIVG
ncbi:MAG: MFS transporter [Ruminococcaceae bacterium]|nr:MFS transporter [Oscillospiraceae bacterium]